MADPSALIICANVLADNAGKTGNEGIAAAGGVDVGARKFGHRKCAGAAMSHVYLNGFWACGDNDSFLVH